jgi:hypothetical protein
MNLKIVTFQFDSNILQLFFNFCEFRNNREELIHFLFGPRQKRTSVRYMYCKICNDSYRFYTAIIMTKLRPVGVATLSDGYMKFLCQGPRTLKSQLVLCFDKFVFQNKYLTLNVSI